MSELAKLRWQCRRGMKELDILLERYLTDVYPNSSTSEQAQFIDLLKLEDDELLAILLQQTSSKLD